MPTSDSDAKNQRDDPQDQNSQENATAAREPSVEVPQTVAKKPAVALVLGSGGARGLAHIGVIEYLLEQGYEIKAIAGSSMGALVGAMYAMGELSTYRDWVAGLSQSDVFSLVDWTFSGGGFIRGHRIMGKLRELAGDANIEDLPLHFTAVTVDIDQGREVWLSDGPVYDAIRASIAIPGLFTPHRYRGRTLVDGGLINPVPVAPTLRTLTDLTVVVNLNGPETEPLHPPQASQPPPAESESAEESGGILMKIRDYLDTFSMERTPTESSPGLMAVVMRSLETMQAVLTRQQMGVFAPDVVVDIPKDACMIHEFHRGEEMITLGRRAIAEALQRDLPRCRVNWAHALSEEAGAGAALELESVEVIHEPATKAKGD
ncbi:MAG: patatin-like phospholipase family protein [Xanthomonadales bacterium]|nr:patatin-like phospholipase family protein [Xanthomonadales bacterium]